MNASDGAASVSKRSRVANMGKKGTAKKRSGSKKRKRTSEQNRRRRLAHMNSEQREAYEARKEKRFMTDEQREAYNEKRRGVSPTSEQRDARNKRELLWRSAKAEAKYAEFSEKVGALAAMRKGGAARKEVIKALEAHVRDIRSKFKAAKAELDKASVKKLIAETVDEYLAIWEAHITESSLLSCRVNVCYSGMADDDGELEKEAYRVFKIKKETVSLVVKKVIETNNGHIANAVEEELQRRLKADERADRTFQLGRRGYRPGAGAGRVRKSYLERDFLIPYKKAGLTDKEAMTMIKMIRYTLPGQGVALAMARPELSGAGGSGDASAATGPLKPACEGQPPAKGLSAKRIALNERKPNFNF